MQAVCSEPQVLLGSHPGHVRTWTNLVNNSPTPDVYFRPEYAAAYAGANITPMALVVDTSVRRFLIPLLRRRIPVLSPSGAQGYDAITPYGYGGVLPLDPEEISSNDAAELLDQIRNWCIDANVVSAMLRLHPLLRQHDGFSAGVARCSGAALRNVGPTAAIDLLSWNDALNGPTGLHKGRRSDLLHARRHLSVIVAACDSHEAAQMLEQFRRIYEQTMTRLSAARFYLFPAAYYNWLQEMLNSDMGVAVAYSDCRPVSAALFLADVNFGHYHLSGATAEGREHKAQTMVLVEGARWLRQRGCRWLHLGGGRQPGDSLYRFKHSFGAKTFEYSYVTLIADNTIYHDLVNLRKSRPDFVTHTNGFFPAYRHPEE